MPDMSSSLSSAASADALLYDPGALGAPAGGLSLRVGPGGPAMTLDQALAQKGDGGQALERYAKGHPDDLAKPEDRLFAQGRFGDIHQLAQQGRAPTPTAPTPRSAGPVGQAAVDAFKAGNASATAALQTQKAGLSKVRAQQNLEMPADKTCNAANTLGSVSTWAARVRDGASLAAVGTAFIPGVDVAAVPFFSTIAVGAGLVNVGAGAASGIIEGIHTGRWGPFALSTLSNGLSSAAGLSGVGAATRAGQVVGNVGYGDLGAGLADQANSQLIDKSKLHGC